MCFLSSLFSDPYAEARAFYGAAFPAMLRHDAWLKASEERGRAVAPTLVDDVSGQVAEGIEPWRCAWALRQHFGPVNSL